MSRLPPLNIELLTFFPRYLPSHGPVRANVGLISVLLRIAGARFRKLSGPAVGERCVEAKKKAKPADDCGRRRTTTEGRHSRLNLRGRCWTAADGSPAVFQTVCGAVRGRPGWVRFPSVPATFPGPMTENVALYP